ncbi:MAG: CcmD family protein [Anaerolineales bacterium]|nr:CcmD family protein [Anaerolineales bacterium]
MADTLNYMILGFVVIFVTIGLHIWSLINRSNRLKKDLALLEDMAEE